MKTALQFALTLICESLIHNFCFKIHLAKLKTVLKSIISCKNEITKKDKLYYLAKSTFLVVMLRGVCL